LRDWSPGMGEQTPAVQVARGASYLWMQTLATTTVGVVAFAFIARLISTSQMGLLAILSLMLSLAQLTAPLALPNAITRFVAEELAQGRRPNAADAIYQSTGMSVGVAALMAVACFMFSSQISAALSTEPIVFQLLAVDIFVTAGFNQTLASALLGAQRFRDYSIIGVAYGVFRQTLILLLLFLFHDFSWIVAAWVISDVFSLLVMAFAVFRFLGPPRLQFNPRRLLRFSLPLMPGNSIGFAYNWYDRALLIPFVSLTELGVYNVTMTAFGVLSAILSGTATALYPAYARIQTVKGRTGLQDAIHVASRYVSFISVPLALGLLATAKPALSLFAGEPYEPGSAALQIITLFFALTVLGNAFGNIFLLLGRTATASATTAVSVAASLATALILLPSFGINGAATSRGVGMLVGFAVTLAVVRGEIRLSFDLEAFWKSIAAGGGMVIAVWLAQYAVYSRYLLLGYVAVGGLAYLAGLRLLRAIHPSDVQLVNQFLGKRYKPLINLLSKLLQARG
jgi:O-antigen/teichoic acid export membrane protein